LILALQDQKVKVEQMNESSAATQVSRRIGFTAFSVAALSIVMPSVLHAQNAVIQGHVLATDGSPIVDATVQLRGTPRSALSPESAALRSRGLRPERNGSTSRHSATHREPIRSVAAIAVGSPGCRKTQNVSGH
jgi:hypothetical protein